MLPTFCVGWPHWLEIACCYGDNAGVATKTNSISDMMGRIFSISGAGGRYRFFRLMFVALLGMPLTVLGQAQTEAVRLGERPTDNGAPTAVEIGLFVIDIDEIDDVNQRFSVDLFVGVRWQDPRLSLAERDRKGQVRFMPIDAVWTPRILFLNDRGLKAQLRQGVEVDDFGNVTYKNRYSGQLAADLDFRNFPFDVQRLPIDLVSYEYTTDEMRFSPMLNIVSRAEEFSIEGWQLKQLEPKVHVFATPTDDSELPRLTYVVEAKRDSDYYVLTMLLPMSLIIFMAWTVFWLQPEVVPSRIAISTASIFSLLALGVSIRLGLPKISYLTRADVFVLGCTLMIFMALGIAVLGSRWASSGHMEKALKANTIVRWVYMLLFAVVAVVAFYR